MGFNPNLYYYAQLCTCSIEKVLNMRHQYQYQPHEKHMSNHSPISSGIHYHKKISDLEQIDRVRTPLVQAELRLAFLIHLVGPKPPNWKLSLNGLWRTMCGNQETLSINERISIVSISQPKCTWFTTRKHAFYDQKNCLKVVSTSLYETN